MNARLLTALKEAARLARTTADAIRNDLPEDDGDPEARKRAHDGTTEEDALEWDEDARLIEQHIKESDRG